MNAETPLSHRRKILSLAWPVILNNILLTFVWIVDMVMVGRLGPVAVAAVGVSGQLFTLIVAITLAVTTGTIALVARYIGAEQKEEADAVLAQSLLIGALLSVILMAPGLIWSEHLFHLFGADEGVTRAGATYLRIIIAGTLFLTVALVCSSALRGAGDTRTPMLISVGANLLNVVLNYGLIFGKLGMPALGVTGAGVATIISFVIEAAAFLLLLGRGNLVLSLRSSSAPFSRFRPEKEMAMKIVRIGSPAALEQGILQLGYLWYLAIITRYGTDPLAAYTIGVNIMSLSFMPGYGFSVAASTLVGQSLGAENPDMAASQGWECSKLALWAMTAIGIVLFVAARPLALVYVSDEHVVALTAEFVRILALCQPAMALHFALSGGLIGAADTRWPLYASFVGMYLIRMPLALLASYALGLSITWIWLIILADHYGKSVVTGLRFLSGKWKYVKV
ncbi:MAG: MATE family efflux transporter [Candidatus Abyssubacteria bacterium]